MGGDKVAEVDYDSKPNTEVTYYKLIAMS